jgi:hypothetical protein
MTKPIELTPEEIEFLLKHVREHREFYRIVACHPKCSEKHRQMQLKIEQLALKLSNGH